MPLPGSWEPGTGSPNHSFIQLWVRGWEKPVPGFQLPGKDTFICDSIPKKVQVNGFMISFLDLNLKYQTKWCHVTQNLSSIFMLLGSTSYHLAQFGLHLLVLLQPLPQRQLQPPPQFRQGLKQLLSLWQTKWKNYRQKMKGLMLKLMA